MSPIFNRYLLIPLFAIFTIFAYAETASKPDPNEPSIFLKSLNSPTDSSISNSALNKTNIAPPGAPAPSNETSLNQLQELQSAQGHLQDALTALERESNQLQASLSVLTGQLTQLSPIHQQTPEQMERIGQLRTEHQQIQNTLTELHQQEVTLQTRVSALNQQLMQLRQALPAATVAVLPATVAASTIPTQITVTTTVPAGTTIANTVPTTPLPLSPALQTTIVVPDTLATTPSSTTPSKVITKQLKQKSPPLTKEASPWLQDPTTMLRIGGVFIVLALLLLALFFWPRKKENQQLFNSADKMNSEENNEEFVTVEEEEDLVAEYDFMGTDEAIPTRLNLARGYIEMGKYLEARKAIEPVFEKGNTSQREEAHNLLRQIEEADS